MRFPGFDGFPKCRCGGFNAGRTKKTNAHLNQKEKSSASDIDDSCPALGNASCIRAAFSNIREVSQSRTGRRGCESRNVVAEGLGRRDEKKNQSGILVLTAGKQHKKQIALSEGKMKKGVNIPFIVWSPAKTPILASESFRNPSVFGGILLHPCSLFEVFADARF